MRELLERRLAEAGHEGVRENLGRWLRFVGATPTEWTELQTLGFRTSHGERSRVAHAAGLDEAVRLLDEAERFVATGHYVIANQVNEAVATRRDGNRWHDALKGGSTTDRDVVVRRVLFIDVDARRPSGTSATDDEVAKAATVGAAIYERLAQHLGGEGGLGYAHSGNGRQLFVALEPVEEAESVALIIRALLAALHRLHSTPEASIDVSVYDAKRLVPAFGTTKRKGAPGVASRPHRRTAFACDADVRRVPFGSIVEMVGWLREEVDAEGKAEIDRILGVEADAPRPAGGAFGQANAVPVEDLVNRLGLSTDGKLSCPGCGSTDGVALVGGGLKCLHQRCANKGVPRRPGFRTPVDLVMEVRRVDAQAAVAYLGREYGFDAKPARPPLRVVRPEEQRESGTKQAILLRPEEREVADEAIAALAASQADLYQRSGALVRIVVEDARPRILPVAPATLRELFSTCIEWIELKEKKGELIRTITHVPRWAVEAVHARGEWPALRPLQAAVQFPVLRPDGSIVAEPGYDPATQVVYVPNEDFGVLPASPTQDDARAAAAELLDVFVDFPFKADANKAACLAALLTPFARYAFEGAVPSVLVDGNAPGAGKSLLANVLGIITMGRELDVRSEATNEDEGRKRILSIARTGDPIVLVDNVTKPIGGGALDAALTARRTWSDRGLGTLDELRTPMVSMWIFTGNNIEFRRKDTKRRCLHVRLEPSEDNPENREGFRHTPLLPWVAQNRVRLVRAALTILRAHAAAGRPQAALPSWGSFEEWTAIIRQAVVWAGLADPYAARLGLEEGDPETTALEGLFAGWEDFVADHGAKKGGCTVAEVIDVLRQDDLARFTPEMRRHPQTYPRLREALAELMSTPPGMLPTANRLGCLLRRFRGRAIQGKRLLCTPHHGTNVWRVEAVSVSAPDATRAVE
jgi:hypothetical protein